MDSNRQIKFGVLMSYFAIGINIITGLIYTPWMISSIGQENYGLFTLANSIMAFFMFDFGLSGAITRYISKYLSEGRLDKANNCLGLVYKLYFGIDLLLFIILAVVYIYIPDIYQKLTLDEIEKFKIVYAIAAVFSVLSFPFIPVDGILTANEKFVQLKACDVLQKLLIVVTMSICLLSGCGLYALVVVNAAAGLISIFAKLWVIRKYTNTKINFNYNNKKEFHEIVGFSGWITISTIAQRFVISILPSLLGILSGSRAIALFGIASALEGFVWLFVSSIGGLFLPKVSRIVAKGNSDLLPLMIKVGRIQFMVVSAITIGFICLGSDFIFLWVGNSFADSYLCAVILILPSFMSTPEGIAAQAILARNKVKQQALVFAYTSAINIFIACFLSYYFGAIGASISVCVVYTARWLWMNIIYKNELELDVIKFYKDSFVKMLPSFVIPLIAGGIINYFLPDGLWGFFLLKMTVFIIVFLIALYHVMNEYEKDLLIRPILRQIKVIK